VLWAGLPGQESGHSLVDVLYGDVNPSARLPYTIAKNRSDYAADVIYTGGSGPNDVQINYTEGLLLDYRWFDAHNITPRYEFGYGLSYTTFEYADLSIEHQGASDANTTAWENGIATGNHTGASLDSWLHEPAYNINFKIKNTGGVDGFEVPQLYLQPPASSDSPPSVLKGFERVKIAKGQTADVCIKLSRYDLSVWDVVQQGWAKQNGTWGLAIGTSSRDFRLNGTIS